MYGAKIFYALLCTVCASIGVIFFSTYAEHPLSEQFLLATKSVATFTTSKGYRLVDAKKSLLSSYLQNSHRFQKEPKHVRSDTVFRPDHVLGPHAKQDRLFRDLNVGELDKYWPLTLNDPLRVNLTVDMGSPQHKIPDTLFGIFFEEINHAGAGGLHAELVQNRGFEAGGLSTPSTIAPWLPIGRESQVWLETEHSSCFVRNPIALRMEILCARESAPGCGAGVGIANKGYWGMDIRAGKRYRVSLWLRATRDVKLRVAFRSENGSLELASGYIRVGASEAATWHKQELEILAGRTDHRGQLAITTKEGGTIWLDQISAAPVSTFKGHGMRPALARMLRALRPGFMRFPGGCYVEGARLANAYRWRQSVGPWEERPGHFNDVWGYWSDDALGLFEFLQFCEDIDTVPVWVFNNGISHTDEVDYHTLGPFVQDMLDGIEFARGPADSKWGRVRSEMGHMEPFPLRHVAIGNEDCSKANYQGSYPRFYHAIKARYPDMKIVSNCGPPLQHPADLYDYHVYTTPASLFALRTTFDSTPRTGPKVFASEYASYGSEVGHGNLWGAIAEAAFMTGLERNSDVVEMASYAPLFVNANDRKWNPDAIVFDSSRQYGTPSYWVQQMFGGTKNATGIPSVVGAVRGAASVLATSAFVRDEEGGNKKVVIKAVNFGLVLLSLDLELKGVPAGSRLSKAKVTLLTSGSPTDENSLADPEMVIPKSWVLGQVPAKLVLNLPGMSLTRVVLKVSVQKKEAA